MRTDDLVGALAADLPRKEAPPARLLAWALAAGAAGACLLFLLLLGPRHDWPAAMHSGRFVLKFVLTVTLGAAALPVVLHLARPGAAAGPRPLLVPLALLVVLVGGELASVPAGLWMRRLVGVNALFCLASIPLLSALPLAALLLALRRAAPTRARLAGAVAGLLAGAVGATFYAAHCTDDSPLFVATWYGIAIAAVTAAGAALGGRVLRW